MIQLLNQTEILENVLKALFFNKNMKATSSKFGNMPKLDQKITDQDFFIFLVVLGLVFMLSFRILFDSYFYT